MGHIMEKILNINIKKFFASVISVILIFSLFISAASSTTSTENELDSNTTERDYTHTVLVEVGTGSWCYWCQFTNAAMHDIYSSGLYDFEYVELVDSNPIAVERIDEFNQYYYPTTFVDGGEEVMTGGSSDLGDYTSMMDISGARTVSNIDASMNVLWLGGDIYMHILLK
jgi:hypothetical protein